MMCLLVLALTQASAAPSIPPGLNEAYVKTAYKTLSDLSAGNFELASRDTELLPTSEIRWRWDDSNVPKGERSAFRSAFLRALGQWSKAIPSLHFSEDPADPNVAFSFTGPLPQAKGASFPAGAALTFGEPPKPRLSDMIALQRMSPPEDTLAIDVHNEAAFAIALYLGLEEVPHFKSFASRTDQNTSYEVQYTNYEIEQGEAALGLADNLRGLAKSNQKVILGKPSMGLSTGSIDGIKGFQDEPVEFSFTVYNKGTSDLRLFVLPDCGCLTPRGPQVIKPNEQGKITADVNTAQFTGHLNHSLLIYSNDPDWSIERLPVTMDIVPLFRFYRPGPRIVEMGSKGASVDVYLVLSPKADFEVLTASLSGLNATVQFHPWSGTLPDDPDSKGAPVKGYKLHVDVGATPIMSEMPTSLVLGTSDPDSRMLYCPITFQHGIVANPGQVYLAETGNDPKAFEFLISRPSGGYKITKIETGSPYLSATFKPTENPGEYLVRLVYNGKAEFGRFDTTLKAYVDDPVQHVVPVPVEIDVK